MRYHPLGTLRRPFKPRLRGGVAGVEDEAPARSEMFGDGPQHRPLVVFCQKNLEHVTGQQHKVKASPEPHRSPVCLDPVDLVAADPAARNVEHGRRRIDASNAASPGHFGGQLTGAATEIEDRARIFGKADAAVKIGTVILVLDVIELDEVGIGVDGIGHTAAACT